MILEKNPEKRMTLQEIADNLWVSNNGKDKIDFKVDQNFIESNQSQRSGSVRFGNLNRLLKKSCSFKIYNQNIMI